MATPGIACKHSWNGFLNNVIICNPIKPMPITCLIQQLPVFYTEAPIVWPCQSCNKHVRHQHLSSPMCNNTTASASGNQTLQPTKQAPKFHLPSLQLYLGHSGVYTPEHICSTCPSKRFQHDPSTRSGHINMRLNMSNMFMVRLCRQRDAIDLYLDSIRFYCIMLLGPASSRDVQGTTFCCLISNQRPAKWYRTCCPTQRQSHAPALAIPSVPLDVPPAMGKLLKLPWYLKTDGWNTSLLLGCHRLRCYLSCRKGILLRIPGRCH